MKLLDIAFKEILRSLRNAFFLFFGLGVPLLATAIFYFAFGGAGSGDGFELPVTQVQVVNLDQAGPEYGGFSAGQILVDFLRSEGMADLVQVTEAADAAAARAAVDRQEAGVAVVIPAGLTAAAFGPGGGATIELYQDPTLTLGPSIVKAIVSQFVDGFAGSKIAIEVASEELAAHGIPVDDGLRQQIAIAYGEWAQEQGAGQQGGSNPLLQVRAPAGGDAGNEGILQMVALIMAGMMVFYAFYTAVASSMTILQEHETGTLARLFTTPTSQGAILGGKFLASWVTVALQVAVLLTFSHLVFGIDWGKPAAIALVTLGTVVVATGLGILLNSLLKNTRQSGIVYGGVLTVMGIGGMISVFSGQMPGSGTGADLASLVTPQGWAVRGYGLLLQGMGPLEVLPTTAVLLGLGIVFFAVGVWRFNRRFA
jgi:ABC-2 type transport system permease protein